MHKLKNCLKWVVFNFGLCLVTLTNAQINLTVDFTRQATTLTPIRYNWGIYNKISPIGSLSTPSTDIEGVNLVRPLGGKASNGNKDLSQDTYLWDGSKYYYDWTPLEKDVRAVLDKTTLFQFMIDQLPWAFQRGVDRQGFPEVETYGNAWPPNDPLAWANYIKAMLSQMIEVYGLNEVQKWRFCIGREIGTPGHWRAGQEAFFIHYKNTEKAVREILPNAKVGAHFLWGSSKNSYGPAFVKWCKANDARYDFIGVSFYPFYNKETRVNLDQVYPKDFSPFKDQPEWNPAATLELHEFALIVTMNGAGNGFTTAADPYQESFAVMLNKMMLENGMDRVFRWGYGDQMNASHQSLLEIKDNTYYKNSQSGNTVDSGAMVNGIFTKNSATYNYDILTYNYNANANATKTEPIKIKVVVPAAVGATIKYRSSSYQKSTNKLIWTSWRTGSTQAGTSLNQSEFSFSDSVEAFSFSRLQFTFDKEWVGIHKKSSRNLPSLLSKKYDAGGNLNITYQASTNGTGILEAFTLKGQRILNLNLPLK